MDKKQIIANTVSYQDEFIESLKDPKEVQNLSGDIQSNEELAEGVSPMQKIIEFFGYQEGLLNSVNMSDFKNPNLGHMICQTSISTLAAMKL